MSAESTLDLSLRDAHRERIAAQLPNLGWVVTGGSVMWFGLATLVDPAAVRAVVPLALQAGILVFQGVLFAAATVLARRRLAGIPPTACAVAACLLAGVIWVWLLTTTATIAAMLTFATLMLLGAAPLVLAWGLGPQLVFQGGLTAVWIALLARLPSHLHMTELMATIAFGNLMSLVVTQGAANAFRTETLARFAALDFDRQIAASRDAYRALAENAPDFIWAVDRAARWTYVNDALARRCGLTPDAMIGRPVAEILAPDDPNPDLVGLIDGFADGDPRVSRPFRMTTAEGPCWVEAIATPIRAADGTLIGVQGVSRDVTERRQAEDALRASEERFRGVFDNAPVGMAVLAPDGRIEQVNRVLGAMFGYEDGELIGRNAYDILHPDDVPQVEALVTTTRAGEREGFSVVCRHRHRDGRTVWNQLHSFLLRDPDGGPGLFVSQVEDITEQRAAEAALRASERRFRSFADSMSAGVVIARTDGILYVNDAVSTITGYGRDELLARHPWDLVDPTERAAAQERVMARLAGERLPPRTAYRLATKSGEPRWVDITVTMLDLDGEPVMLGTAFDVTDRRCAEEALRASEARYRGLVESQRELVLRFAADGRVTFANDAYCQTYGLDCARAIGEPFWPLVHPDDVSAVRAAVAATLLPPYRVTVEARSRTVDGDRWFEWEASAIRDADGVVLEGQAAGRDVTQRRRTQDELRASLEDLRRSEEKLRLLAQRQVAVREEERKRLSLDLHDDVCQELVAVGILVESAAGRLGAAAPEVTHDLERATGYLGEVVDHLRVLARDLRPLVLHDLGLESALRSLALGLSSAATTVEAVFATPIPRLEESAEVTIHRIAQEALTNAVRHAQAHRVTVALSAIGGRLRLEVRDDGRGFDVDGSETRHALGLAGMQERAQALSGRLVVESLRGTGTVVRLDCPLLQRPDASAA